MVDQNKDLGRSEVSKIMDMDKGNKMTEQEKCEEGFENWLGEQDSMQSYDEDWLKEGDSVKMKQAYLQGRRDEQKGRQEEIERLQEQCSQDLKSLARFDAELKSTCKEIEKLRAALDMATQGRSLSDPKWKEAK